MSDWSRELSAALASGETQRMREALARVPQEAMRQALPLLEEMAARSERDGRLEEASFYRDCAVDAAPERLRSRAARAGLRLRLARYAEALDDATRLLAASPSDSEAARIAAQAHEAMGDAERALPLYRIAAVDASDSASAEAVRRLESELLKADALRRTLDPDAEPMRIETPPPPEIAFDPAVRDDPTMPADAETFRIDGIARHLWRYSGQSSPRNAIARLQDPLWRDAWNRALAATAGKRVRFVGSELGVLALCAHRHGAAHVLCDERYPLDARIATGMVQKHFIGPWHARYGDAIRDWSEEERRASFEEFARAVDIAAPSGAPGSQERVDQERVDQERVDQERADEDAGAPCDVLAFPQIDHTLLGTGIVRAVRRHPTPEVLPARAALFAMAVRWRYPDDGARPFALNAVDRLRWSAYPQPLDLDAEFWEPMTAPTRVGAIEFAAFEETAWDLALPALRDGRIDAILVWFELRLGDLAIDSGPDSALRCLRPAVYDADGVAVRVGDDIALRIEAHETRLHARTVPSPSRPHAQGLPSWYVPMLGDTRRNAAYREALRRSIDAAPVRLALDIGAGCGLLSMLAADAGAARVIGCEQQPGIAAAGRETLAANGYADRVSLIEKECRSLRIPSDMPERADLALFELFDCSLIGEGVLHFLHYAREHLLTADARFLPMGATLRAMAVEYRLDRLLDVDASLLNPYLASPEFANVDAKTLDYRPLSAPFDVFEFDFATAGPEPQERALAPVATADGTVGAILFWFDLRMDAATVLSNAPDGDGTHWKQGLQFLPEAKRSAGEPLPLVARHNGSALRFQWQGESMPSEVFSRLPRLDPRWLAANAELEQQTRQLLQHCAHHPEEYAKVARIAQRMAVDPARYGLDPTIAQRFMRMFLNAKD
jgi:protein arginine N-methyltransferase 7